MAEEPIHIRETPEKPKLKGIHQRRYSTGNLSLAKGGGVDVSPRYLGTSVTSCHDLCKYGIKHEREDKPWLRKSKRYSGEQKDLVRDVLITIAEGKRKPVIIKNEPKKIAPKTDASTKQSSSLKPKSLERASSVPDDLKNRKSGKGSLENKQNPAKNHVGEDIPEKIIYTVDTKQEQLTQNGTSRPKLKHKQIKNNSLLSALSLSHSKKSIKKSESGTGAKNQTTDCKVKYPVQNGGSDEKGSAQLPSLSPGEEKPENGENRTDIKKQKRTRNGSHTSSLPLKKILTPVRKGSSSSSSSPPSFKLRPRLPQRSSMSKTVSESENKVPNQSKSTGRPRRVKIVSLEEKVRAPKKLITRPGKASSSSLSSVASSESTKDVEVDPNSGAKSENKTPDPQVKRAGRLRRVKPVGLEDEDGSPKKLHFRRGKVVDIQPKNVIPRILKFKQRVLLGENQSGKGEAWRRTMKKLVGGEEPNGFSSGTTVKVALRHQSVEGKKVDKSLFNNVIEETATMLAQTRKSKVKALVGAFETVISLQDKKPKPLHT